MPTKGTHHEALSKLEGPNSAEEEPGEIEHLQMLALAPEVEPKQKSPVKIGGGTAINKARNQPMPKEVLGGEGDEIMLTLATFPYLRLSGLSLTDETDKKAAGVEKAKFEVEAYIALMLEKTRGINITEQEVRSGPMVPLLRGGLVTKFGSTQKRTIQLTPLGKKYLTKFYPPSATKMELASKPMPHLNDEQPCNFEDDEVYDISSGVWESLLPDDKVILALASNGFIVPETDEEVHKLIASYLPEEDPAFSLQQARQLMGSTTKVANRIFRSNRDPRSGEMQEDRVLQLDKQKLEDVYPKLRTDIFRWATNRRGEKIDD